MLLEIFERVSPESLVSPFLGSGSFEYQYARKFPAVKVLCSDINAALLSVHRVYSEDAKGLETILTGLSPRLSREASCALKARYASMNEISSDPADAAEFVRFMCNSFAGKYGTWCRSTRNLSVRALRTPCPPNISVSRNDAFALLRDHLRSPSPGRVAWYLDPPYCLNEPYYAGFSKVCHAELAEILMEIEYWVLSYNDCPEIRSLYSSCHIFEVSRKRNAVSHKSDKHRELLILSPAVFALKSSMVI